MMTTINAYSLALLSEYTALPPSLRAMLDAATDMKVSELYAHQNERHQLQELIRVAIVLANQRNDKLAATAFVRALTIL